MLKLLTRKVNHYARVFYRGTLTPRAEEYAFLMKQGLDVKLAKTPESGTAWTLILRHKDCKASAADRELHEMDEYHRDNRSVVCDPVSGMFGKFKRLRRSTFLATGDTDRMMVMFPDAATEAMAVRARATIGLLKSLMEELAEFKLPVLAKIGYEADGGDGGEHMWFTVHGFEGDSIDATLESQPFHIERMKAGDRGLHDIKRLTEWSIMSPVGRISPDSLTPVRRIRENIGEFRAMMKELNEGE